MEGVEGLGVDESRICAMLEEEMDDVDPRVPGGPHEGGGHQLATEGIDDGTTGDEESGDEQMAVDGGPMEWADRLMVGVRWMSEARVEEMDDGVEITTLGGEMEWTGRMMGRGSRAGRREVILRVVGIQG